MMPFKTTFATYGGSAGKPNPKCCKCGGTGYHWNYGGRKCKNKPGFTGMPGPESDFIVSCNCQWQGWQYHED